MSPEEIRAWMQRGLSPFQICCLQTIEKMSDEELVEMTQVKLAEKFGVTPKTIYRTLEALRAVGVYTGMDQVGRRKH